MRIFSYILYMFCQYMWHNECVTRVLEARNLETPRMLYGCCITSLATPTPHQLQHFQNKDAHIFWRIQATSVTLRLLLRQKIQIYESPYWSRVNRPRYFSYCTMIWAYIIHLLIARAEPCDGKICRPRNIGCPSKVEARHVRILTQRNKTIRRMMWMYAVLRASFIQICESLEFVTSSFTYLALPWAWTWYCY